MVLHVLGVREHSQVLSAVVELVTVAVIHAVAARKTHDEPMEHLVIGAPHVAASVSMPSLSKNTLGINVVDKGVTYDVTVAAP